MEFIEITPENYSDAKKLSVKPEQSKYVASLKDTLADAYVYKESEFRLVMHNGNLIGYILVYPYEANGEIYVNIVRLAIDEKYQGNGFGKLLLDNLILWISEYYTQVRKIRISTLSENKIALKLYLGRGFKKAGIEEEEIALYMNLNRKSWVQSNYTTKTSPNMIFKTVHRKNVERLKISKTLGDILKNRLEMYYEENYSIY